MNFLLDPMWGGLYVRNGVAGKGQGATVAGRLLGKASLESISFWDPFLSSWEGWGFSSFFYCGHPKILHNFTHPYLFNSPTRNFFIWWSCNLLPGLIPEEEIALQLVFHDEAQHAALAWQTIHWALLADDGNVEKLLQTALENLKLRRLERRKHSFCKVTF